MDGIRLWSIAMTTLMYILILLALASPSLACDPNDCGCNVLCRLSPFVAVGMEPTDALAQTVRGKRFSEITGDVCGHRVKLASGMHLHGSLVLDEDALLQGSDPPIIDEYFINNGGEVTFNKRHPPMVGHLRQDFDDPANAWVIRDGQHVLYPMCLDALESVVPVADRLNDLTPTMLKPSTDIRQAETWTLPAGNSVLRIDGFLRVRSGAVLTINGQPDSRVVVQVAGNMTLDNGAKVQLAGIDAGRVAWVVGGDRFVIVGSTAESVGTIIAPGQDRLRIGTKATHRGALYGRFVKFGNRCVVEYVPFVGGMP